MGGDSGDSDSGSSSSGSSGSDSDSDSDSAESEAEPAVTTTKSLRSVRKSKLLPVKKDPEPPVVEEESKVKEEAVKEPEPVLPKKKVDEVRPGANCKHCSGDISRNKVGAPELLLHCTKCSNSSHPTCVGLHLDLLQFVTNYEWECTDCKKCMTCNDPADEDKMLFCDLCDRGFHIYCVGLDGIPGGRWQCEVCSHCVSCSAKTPAGDGSLEPVSSVESKDSKLEWVFETKTSMKGDKIYSHTMCVPCHKQWKKGLYCPECNGVFGRDPKSNILSSCWETGYSNTSSSGRDGEPVQQAPGHHSQLLQVGPQSHTDQLCQPVLRVTATLSGSLLLLFTIS